MKELKEILSKRLLLFALTWVAISLLSSALPGFSYAADNPIKASGSGLKVASALRKFGWPDEAVVFTLGTLPVLELRGAIPVGYWMKLDPLKLTLLSILGYFYEPFNFHSLIFCVFHMVCLSESLPELLMYLKK
jgi:hypothetical protein